MRPKTFSSPPAAKSFQSTHSLRSATNGSFTLTAAPNVSIHALLTECDTGAAGGPGDGEGFNPRTPYGVRPGDTIQNQVGKCFNPRTPYGVRREEPSAGFRSTRVSIHALLTECDARKLTFSLGRPGFNPRTPYGVRPAMAARNRNNPWFQSTHSLRSATVFRFVSGCVFRVSIHALLTECDVFFRLCLTPFRSFNPRTPYGVRLSRPGALTPGARFQSTHSLRSATAADLIHCYSTEQIILCANLPKKTVIARLHFLSIYLSIFYSQCITPIADLPGNSCELEVDAQAMFNSL